MTQKNAVERIGDRVMSVVERLLALGLCVAIMLAFINAMGRYTNSFTLLGADEIQTYILIWIAFVGAVVIAWQRKHLRMDVLYNACSSPVRKIITAFEMSVMLGVCGFAAMESFTYVHKIHALDVHSAVVGIPMWIPHAAVGLCFTSIAVIVVIHGVKLFRSANADAKQDGQ